MRRSYVYCIVVICVVQNFFWGIGMALAFSLVGAIFSSMEEVRIIAMRVWKITQYHLVLTPYVLYPTPCFFRRRLNQASLMRAN